MQLALAAALLLAAPSKGAPAVKRVAPAPAAVPAPAAPAAARDAPMGEEERAYCESEIAILENRRKLFEAQGLPAAEVARKNGPQLRALAECRDRFRADARRAEEQRQDLAEAARRAGPSATELDRERVWREVRRERLGSKTPASLTESERAELTAGMGDELKATHRALDEAHQRDPSFMRIVHSAIACYHGGRKAELQELVSSEESHVKLGSGDRQRLYALKSELRGSDEILGRNAEASRGLPGGLERCTDPKVAVVSHCLGLRATAPRAEPACESEEIQQYLRFVK